MRQITSAIVFLAAAIVAQSAQAFFDPPWITPPNPTAGDIVSINIHGGVCDTIFGEDGYPQITQAGSDVRIVWYGQHWPEGSGDLLCSFGIGTLTYPIGTFSPGSHTITVDLAYRDFFGMPSILTIGVVPFTIAGAPSAVTPVPTSSPVGLLTLLIALGLTACFWRTRQTTSS